MISLRRVNEQDRERLFNWRNLPAVRCWMMTSHEIEPAEHDRWFEGMLSGTVREQWIILRDEMPVGSVYITGLGEGCTTPSFGIYLGEASTRGAGVGHQALRLLFSEVFSRHHIDSIDAEVLVNNHAACHLYERIGMSRAEPESGQEQALGVVRYIMTKQAWVTGPYEGKTGNEA
jgi:UDP-4-amino-4,6-dideoxy-N-acetyl-beta-L-altrosamine N-acetyltransferase